MIERLQSDSTNSVASMNQGRELAQEVAVQAEEAGELLATISEEIARITEMSTQIASAAEERGVFSEEVNCNIVQINDKTIQTATGADQLTQAAHSVAQMATELNELIAQFRVADEGGQDLNRATGEVAWAVRENLQKDVHRCASSKNRAG